jgi:hypothetical protein
MIVAFDSRGQDDPEFYWAEALAPLRRDTDSDCTRKQQNSQGHEDQWVRSFSETLQAPILSTHGGNLVDQSQEILD